MLVFCVILGLCLCEVESLVQNVRCPVVKPRELDWKALDGIWYIAAVASDLQPQADCAMLMFTHMDSTDVAISWISNNTITYYNGSVSIIADPNSNTTGDLLLVAYSDKRSETYSLLDVDYEHYAVLFACYNGIGNSSTYELWKLTRSPHLKESDGAKLDQAIANYQLQETNFTIFNNTEDTCRVNGENHMEPSLILTSAAALTIFRRLY